MSIYDLLTPLITPDFEFSLQSNHNLEIKLYLFI